MLGLLAEDGCVVVSHLIISVVALEMSSVQSFRDFINERLTAAAVEIFSVFERTIVQYEKEIDRQRRLLDISWKPQKNSHRAELLQQHVCKEEEEVLTEQKLCHQENASVDQEELEPPTIKEEREGLCSNQDGGQLALKQESDTVMVTLAFGESDHSESELDREQLLSHYSPAAEDQRGSEHVESGSTRIAELQPNSPMLESQCVTDTGTKSVKCDFCGKAFTKKSIMKRHQRIHTGEKPHSCKICGKSFRDGSVLLRHMRIHTGEKPYVCTTCGKSFKDNSVLLRHLRIHTGEKPYACKTCGKSFKDSSALLRHVRIHTGEKLHACNTCGKRFNCKTRLSSHMKIHTSEKPYSCKICGKSFKFNFKLSYHERTHTDEKSCLCNTCGKTFTDPSTLKRHMRIHTDVKPYSCETCGKSFRDNYKLLYHMKTHTDEKLQS